MSVIFWLACASPAVVPPRQWAGEEGMRGELVVDGPLEARLSSAPADLIIFYGGEERGDLGPCGCPDRPRGGLARQQAYMRAAAGTTPALAVNAGGWLDDRRTLEGEPRPEAPLLNGYMVRGQQQIGAAALNISTGDLAGLAALGRPPELPMVSANLSAPGLKPAVELELAGLRLAITGISAPTLAALPVGTSAVEPRKAARPLLRQLRERADLVVLLAWSAPEAARDLAREGLVDLVIDAQQHRGYEAPFRVGSAVWVRSFDQTERLGELRLDLEGGRLQGVLDRQIPMDDRIPADPVLSSLQSAAEGELKRLEKALYRR
jgi:hypothetical protein